MADAPDLALRKIIHIDMDAFFASVEQLDHPEWRGRPVIVGGDPERRGVVSTASYEARKFGIHSAMPAKTAHRLCPRGIFTPGNFARYKEVSGKIREIFRSYTELVEPLSIDEAFLDVTQNRADEPSATRLAMRIRTEIREKIGLTASAGVSYNKFLAKIASDFHKPDGLTVIPPTRAAEFIAKLPIEKFYGVGAVGAATFRTLGIVNGATLLKAPLELLTKHFGKIGHFYYEIVRGVDLRPVDPSESRKSIGRETTFPYDVDDLNKLKAVLHELALRVAILLARHKQCGRTVTLKIRYEDFTTVTRSFSHPRAIAAAEALEATALELLTRTEAGARKVRLLGLSVSGFPEADKPGPRQPELPFRWENDLNF